MPTKHVIKWPVVKDPTLKKEKAAGWARSGFTTDNLNKLKKVRLLSKAAGVMIPGDEVVLHPYVGFGNFPFFPLPRSFSPRPRISPRASLYLRRTTSSYHA
jgi:hypothetical protein